MATGSIIYIYIHHYTHEAIQIPKTENSIQHPNKTTSVRYRGKPPKVQVECLGQLMERKNPTSTSTCRSCGPDTSINRHKFEHDVATKLCNLHMGMNIVHICAHDSGFKHRKENKYFENHHYIMPDANMRVQTGTTQKPEATNNTGH